MRDLLFDPQAAAAKSPEASAQQHMRPVLPKRFYKQVTIAPDEAQGETPRWLVLLDGRKVKTPAKALLALPNEASARLVANEWEAQVEKIDPATMPMTRLVNTAIDGIAADPQAVLEDIVRFAANDLVCYRADAQEALIAAQRTHWDAILDRIAGATGAHFEVTEGIIHVAQPREAVLQFSAHLARHCEPVKLACLHTMTTLTGSALIAYCLAEHLVALEEAWAAAHVDEDHNISLWGEDYEAGKRRKARLTEMTAAYRLFACIGRIILSSQFPQKDPLHGCFHPIHAPVNPRTRLLPAQCC